MKKAENKCLKDISKLPTIIKRLKKQGKRIVLTQGSFDLLHIGHARYIRAAKEQGDILIVGVDNDIKIRNRKGANRPVVPETERVEMISHLSYVDIVLLKSHEMPKWFYIKEIMPDILIATKETYTKTQIKALKEFCGKVVILEPMATTSTSAKLRKLQIDFAEKIKSKILPKVTEVIENLLEDIKNE